MNAGRCCRSRGRWHGLPFRSRNSPDGPNLLFRVPGGPWRRRLTVKLGRFAVDSRHARGPQGDRTGPRPQSLPVPAVCSATASHASAHCRADLICRMSDKPLTDITFSSFELQPALQAGLDSVVFTPCTPLHALTLPDRTSGEAGTSV